VHNGVTTQHTHRNTAVKTRTIPLAICLCQCPHFVYAVLHILAVKL